MADATAATPAPRKRAAFTRTERPTFVVITAKDAAGNPVVLDKTNTTVLIEKDSAKLLDLLTAGGLEGVTVIRATMPAPTPRKPSGTVAA